MGSRNLWEELKEKFREISKNNVPELNQNDDVPKLNQNDDVPELNQNVEISIFLRDQLLRLSPRLDNFY